MATRSWRRDRGDAIVVTRPRVGREGLSSIYLIFSDAIVVTPPRGFWVIFGPTGGDTGGVQILSILYCQRLLSRVPPQGGLADCFFLPPLQEADDEDVEVS